MIDEMLVRQKAEKERVSANLVFKEYAHVVILDYLFRRGLFSRIVFQGGTALRLAHGGVRYSEDLDFVLRERGDFLLESLSRELKSLASHMKRSIPLVRDARLKTQKMTRSFARFHLSMDVPFLQGTDRINIEIANVPSYANRAIILRRGETLLSPGIVVETPEEILSDKFVAFCGREYVKGRDVWDIYYIVNTLGIIANEDVMTMAKRKISDYGLTLTQFRAGFEKNLSLLYREGVAIMKEEMDRFLPASYRNLFETRYAGICREVVEILNAALGEMETK